MFATWHFLVWNQKLAWLVGRTTTKHIFSISIYKIILERVLFQKMPATIYRLLQNKLFFKYFYCIFYCFFFPDAFGQIWKQQRQKNPHLQFFPRLPPNSNMAEDAFWFEENGGCHQKLTTMPRRKIFWSIGVISLIDESAFL